MFMKLQQIVSKTEEDIGQSNIIHILCNFSIWRRYKNSQEKIPWPIELGL